MSDQTLSQSYKNAQQKRNTILRTAEKLFLEQGYGITSMDKIAEKAGITKQTVYRYFSSKENLFVAVMESIRKTDSGHYSFSSQSVQEELQHYGEYVLAFHLHPSALGLYRLMLTEGVQENLSQVFMKTGPKQVTQTLITFLQQRYPEHTECEFFAQMFISMVLAPRNQVLMSGKKHLKKSAQKEHIQKVVECFLKMIES